MRLNVKALAISTAIAGMLLYAVGAVIDVSSAWGAAAVVSYIFRLDVIEASLPHTLGSFVVGLASFGLAFGAFGASVAWTYNRVAREAPARTSAPVGAVAR
jgi:hypothetical protein